MVKSYTRILNEGFSNYIKKLEESANDTSITVYNVSGKPQIPLNFNNFKEIGLHCGTYDTVKTLLEGRYQFSEKPYFIYKIDLNLSHSMTIEYLSDWGSLEAVIALLNGFGYDEEEIEEVIKTLRQKNADRKQYSSFCRKLCLKQGVNVLEYVNEAEFLKFEYYFGDSQNSDADIKIHDKVNTDGSTVIGYANLGSRDTERIRGNVTIYTNVFHSMGMKATVVHELLHVLGLEHSENVYSIMCPNMCCFFMSTEDVKQVNTLYPAEEEKTTTNNNFNYFSYNNDDLSK